MVYLDFHMSIRETRRPIHVPPGLNLSIEIAGDSAYIKPHKPGESLATAVRNFPLQEVVIFDPSLPSFTSFQSEHRNGKPALSERNVQVLRLVVEGLSHKEIGTRLGIRDSTVGEHVGNMVRKTATTALEDLIRYSYETNILEGYRKERYIGKPLTSHRRTILQLLAHGKSNDEIAAVLGNSPETVRTILSSIYNDMGVSGRVGAVALACRTGLV